MTRDISEELRRRIAGPSIETLEQAIAHAEKYDMMDQALWPYQPFSVTIGDLLTMALRDAKRRAER